MARCLRRRLHPLFVVAALLILSGAPLPAQEIPADSIDGWTTEQVQEALGRPSMRDR